MAPLLRVERRLLGSEPSVQTATLKRYMAGVVGFEPTILVSKTSALTAWPYPYIKQDTIEKTVYQTVA